MTKLETDHDSITQQPLSHSAQDVDKVSLSNEKMCMPHTITTYHAKENTKRMYEPSIIMKKERN